MGIKLRPPTTPPPQPAPAPVVHVLNSPRARELSKLLGDALKAEEASLSGRQFSTDTLADVIAVAIAAYEANGHDSVKRRLKPNVRKQGFDPLWSDKTYEMVTDRGSEGIKCLRCEKVSFHPKDIENRYCGNCQEFHDG